MKNFRDLLVWEKSHLLTLKVYGCTKSFPKEEIYGLTSQMRRSSSSIPTNIAEGCGRNSDPQFAKFLNFAFGSASELEYQLILSRDLEYVSKVKFSEVSELNEEVKKMLASLLKSVGKK